MNTSYRLEPAAARACCHRFGKSLLLFLLPTSCWTWIFALPTPSAATRALPIWSATETKLIAQSSSADSASKYVIMQSPAFLAEAPGRLKIWSNAKQTTPSLLRSGARGRAMAGNPVATQGITLHYCVFCGEQEASGATMTMSSMMGSRASIDKEVRNNQATPPARTASITGRPGCGRQQSRRRALSFTLRHQFCRVQYRSNGIFEACQ
jgi:hypothetical protein